MAVLRVTVVTTRAVVVINADPNTAIVRQTGIGSARIRLIEFVLLLLALVGAVVVKDTEFVVGTRVVPAGIVETKASVVLCLAYLVFETRIRRARIGRIRFLSVLRSVGVDFDALVTDFVVPQDAGRARLFMLTRIVVAGVLARNGIDLLAVVLVQTNHHTDNQKDQSREEEESTHKLPAMAAVERAVRGDDLLLLLEDFSWFFVFLLDLGLGLFFIDQHGALG